MTWSRNHSHQREPKGNAALMHRRGMHEAKTALAFPLKQALARQNNPSLDTSILQQRINPVNKQHLEGTLCVTVYSCCVYLFSPRLDGTKHKGRSWPRGKCDVRVDVEKVKTYIFPSILPLSVEFVSKTGSGNNLELPIANPSIFSCNATAACEKPRLATTSQITTEPEKHCLGSLDVLIVKNAIKESNQIKLFSSPASQTSKITPTSQFYHPASGDYSSAEHSYLFHLGLNCPGNRKRNPPQIPIGESEYECRSRTATAPRRTTTGKIGYQTPRDEKRRCPLCELLLATNQLES